MFGSKLRSWMEAVRPRKKQQRNKDKQQKSLTNASAVFTATNTAASNIKNSQSSETQMKDVDSKSMQTIASQGARYSGTNLSSPESAYSTGYSTDGTSPGAPPEYYINIRSGTRYAYPTETNKCPKAQIGSNDIDSVCTQAAPDSNVQRPLPVSSHAQLLAANTNLSHEGANIFGTTPNPILVVPDSESNTIPARRQPNNIVAAANGLTSRLPEVVLVQNAGLLSPRQRNRIRTNPWLPGSNLSPGNSSITLHVTRQETHTPTPTPTPRGSVRNSPVPTRYLNSAMGVPCTPVKRPVARCDSLSSSSCSSLSAASLNWDSNLVRDRPSVTGNSAKNSSRVYSASDEEDDCTLNEMMGKYDESYVYEKETDILSDSDPTDCETDIDTGQDGGDEDDPLETELDFIDNDSFLEFNIKDERLNTGHCTYYNFEMQRKCSRRRVSRRSQRESGSKEKRRRSTNSKRRHRGEKTFFLQEGTRSAGATPVSVRKTKHPVSKLAIEDRLRKRSNSVSIPRDPVHYFDQRDKEAEKKYKELIVEAEHILKNIKCNQPAAAPAGLSPRRVPGPANKRVELLRTENTPKPDVFIRNRLIEEVSNLHLTRVPSNVSPRFSPKRNHITKFISSNSPIMVRREEPRSPMMVRNENARHAKRQPLKNGDLVAARSPKTRKKLSKVEKDDRIIYSSDSETAEDTRQLTGSPRISSSAYLCPQSEPVKRKVYSNQKTVAFKLGMNTTYAHEEAAPFFEENTRKSCESLRQQVLMNTITNLKRSLEDQSESLKQIYSRSSQNLQA